MYMCVHKYMTYAVRWLLGWGPSYDQPASASPVMALITGHEPVAQFQMQYWEPVVSSRLQPLWYILPILPIGIYHL